MPAGRWPGTAGARRPAGPAHWGSSDYADALPTKAGEWTGIIVEGVLFVALIATVAAFLFYALLWWTPLGLRLRQTSTPPKVPALYSTFRTDIATIQHTYVKQAIRQALQEVAGDEEIAAIIGPKKAEVTGRVTKLVEDRLSAYGSLVKQFTINELRAPPSIIEAINQETS